MKISHKFRILTASFILILTSLTLQLIYNNDISIYEDVKLIGAVENGFGFLNFIASPLMFNFIIGMIIYCLHEKMKMIKEKGLLAFLFISIFLCMYLYNFHYKHGIYGFGMWAIFLLSGTLLYETRHQLAKFGPLIFLGDISYSLYLVHPLIMRLMAVNHEFIPMYDRNSPAKFLMIISTSIIAAYLLHKFVELPFINLGKQVINLYHRRNKSKTTNAS